MVKPQIKEAQCRFHPGYSEICVCIFHIFCIKPDLLAPSRFVMFLKRKSRSNLGQTASLLFTDGVLAVRLHCALEQLQLVQLCSDGYTRSLAVIFIHEDKTNMNILWYRGNVGGTKMNYRPEIFDQKIQKIFDLKGSWLWGESGEVEALWSSRMST